MDVASIAMETPVTAGGVSRAGRIGHALMAAALAVVLLASFLGADRWWGTLAAAAGDEAPTICILKRVTGLPCATCGMTRSFCALARGEIGRAVGLHPLGPAVFGLFAVAMVRSAGIAVSGRRWMNRTARVLVWSIPVLVLAALGLWIVRLAAMAVSGAAGAAWAASPMAKLISMMN